MSRSVRNSSVVSSEDRSTSLKDRTVLGESLGLLLAESLNNSNIEIESPLRNFLKICKETGFADGELAAIGSAREALADCSKADQVFAFQLVMEDIRNAAPSEKAQLFRMRDLLLPFVPDSLAASELSNISAELGDSPSLTTPHSSFESNCEISLLAKLSPSRQADYLKDLEAKEILNLISQIFRLVEEGPGIFDSRRLGLLLESALKFLDTKDTEISATLQRSAEQIHHRLTGSKRYKGDSWSESKLSLLGKVQDDSWGLRMADQSLFFWRKKDDAWFGRFEKWKTCASQRYYTAKFYITALALLGRYAEPKTQLEYLKLLSSGVSDEVPRLTRTAFSALGILVASLPPGELFSRYSRVSLPHHMEEFPKTWERVQAKLPLAVSILPVKTIQNTGQRKRDGGETDLEGMLRSPDPKLRKAAFVKLGEFLDQHPEEDWITMMKSVRLLNFENLLSRDSDIIKRSTGRAVSFLHDRLTRIKSPVVRRSFVAAITVAELSEIDRAKRRDIGLGPLGEGLNNLVKLTKDEGDPALTCLSAFTVAQAISERPRSKRSGQSLSNTELLVSSNLRLLPALPEELHSLCLEISALKGVNLDSALKRISHNERTFISAALSPHLEQVVEQQNLYDALAVSLELEQLQYFRETPSLMPMRQTTDKLLESIKPEQLCFLLDRASSLRQAGMENETDPSLRDRFSRLRKNLEGKVPEAALCFLMFLTEEGAKPLAINADMAKQSVKLLAARIDEPSTEERNLDRQYFTLSALTLLAFHEKDQQFQEEMLSTLRQPMLGTARYLPDWIGELYWNLTR